MVVLVSEKLGSVYTLDPDTNSVLYYTALYPNGDYSSNFDDYDEVDWLAVLGEDETVLKELHRIEDLLKADI